ncbi:hypothetical protein [Georgenia satyanarayanai]|uniref:hypothetical protein n=1 Tax=Georgenia satyanarayanai TaxID=860221 RepID=UPI000DA1EE37|nr:hypothetical protein [Georgenia satyanarayanai]
MALLAVAGLLAGCAGDPPVETEPAVLEDRAAPSEEVHEDSLPLALSGLPVLDPGWDQVPQELDGLLLGLDHPEDGEPLRFVAAREDGTLLWRAERPPSCTGFTLSRAGERTIAILNDVTPGRDTLSETSASAYDLATGELVWGPVDVPGPLQGPGAVFAAPAPRAAMGETGPRVVLDPATGEVVASEDDDVTVVGEYAGVVLTATDGTLHADGAGTSWQLPLADLGTGPEPGALPGVQAPPGTALLGEPGQALGVLVDLTTGEVLATGVRDAVTEPISGTLVTVEDGSLVGRPDGERWERPTEGLGLSAAGNLFAYLRSDSAVRAVNVVTGADAVAYDDGVTEPAVPVLVTAGGATVVEGADVALVPAGPSGAG